MLTFESQEAFEEAVMQVMFARMTVGVTVKKERKCYYGTDEYTKVKVTLFDKRDGRDIDSSSDSA